MIDAFVTDMQKPVQENSKESAKESANGNEVQ